MKMWQRQTGLAAVVTVAFGAWLAVASGQQKAPTTQQANADALLGAAQYQEQIEGRLEAAIATYRKVLVAADATREQKARAQFRIGACYERLGLAEARKAYEAVVANYADQTALAAEAKARLAALAEPAARGAGPVVRQIWATTGGVEQGRISPDGRSLVGVDEKTGDLMIRSLATGDTRRLTAIPKDRQGAVFADAPVWSRDGRSVAYVWYLDWKPIEPGPSEFRIADVADGTSRTVPIDARFRPYWPQDWSPDGRRMLAKVRDVPPSAPRDHLAWVSTSTGTLQLLESAGTAYRLGSAFLSPDGAWIVSRFLEDDTAFSIMPAGGGPPRTLIPARSSDSLVGWSPDGTHVLFISRERGSDDLMAVRVVDGQAAGQPLLIRTFQQFSSLGISRAGALLYRSGQRFTPGLYRASFDATSGQVGPPSRVDVSPLQSVRSVSWSPDGRRLAYQSYAGGDRPRTLSIWSAEHAQTRSFSLPFAGTWRPPMAWSTDGRWVYLAGFDDADRAGLYRINTESGTVEGVVPPASGVFPKADPSNTFAMPVGWSPDARLVYKQVNYVEKGVQGPVAIVEHRLADHAERELLRIGTTRVPIAGFRVSPDGSQLAFWMIDMARPTAEYRLMVAPAAGGPGRIVATLPSGVSTNWTPDGRSLVFGKQNQVWLCDVATGAVTKLTPALEGVDEVAVSPDGKQIAYTGGRKGTSEGVWMLENFLPKPKAPAAAPRK